MDEFDGGAIGDRECVLSEWGDVGVGAVAEFPAWLEVVGGCSCRHGPLRVRFKDIGGIEVPVFFRRNEW